jgi:hypothetical protein
MTLYNSHPDGFDSTLPKHFGWTSPFYIYLPNFTDKGMQSVKKKNFRLIDISWNHKMNFKLIEKAQPHFGSLWKGKHSLQFENFYLLLVCHEYS